MKEHEDLCKELMEDDFSAVDFNSLNDYVAKAFKSYANNHSESDLKKQCFDVHKVADLFANQTMRIMPNLVHKLPDFGYSYGLHDEWNDEFEELIREVVLGSRSNDSQFDALIHYSLTLGNIYFFCNDSKEAVLESILTEEALNKRHADVPNYQFIIVGRFHGDDDDTALVVKAPDLTSAIAQFKQSVLEWNDVSEDYDDATEENSVYITNALVTQGVVSEFSKEDIALALSFNDPLASAPANNQSELKA